MSTGYPPSSPTGASTVKAAVSQSVSIKNFKNVDLKSLTQDVKQFPTPDPSSSIGLTPSSPIRRPQTIPTSPVRYSESQDDFLAISSSIFNVELSNDSVTRLTIGRKPSVCDIVLPNLKNISRQHVFITYFNEEKQIKIECNGTNGIIVLLPNNGIDCYISRKEGNDHFFQVTLESPTEVKLPKKSQRLTSFVLVKDETVLMPLIENMKIDFRQAKLSFTLNQTINSNDGNLTETEDEMLAVPIAADLFNRQVETPSRKKFISIPESPSTEQLNQRQDSPYQITNTSITPQIDNVIKDPKTPQKIKKSIFKEVDYETPIPDQSTESRHDLKNGVNEGIFGSSQPSFNFPVTPEHDVQNSRKRRKLQNVKKAQSEMESIEVTKPTKHQRKNSKKTKNSKSDDIKDLILDNLKAKGINCKEIQHILSNHLAFAAQQQTPLSQLQKTSKSVSQLNTDELRILLENEASIGVIKREGKDAAGKLLEEEFYYDIENDSDEDRKRLVTSLKGGRAGIRSSRKMHKQYYWKRPAKK